MRVVPLIITPSDPLAKFLPPLSTLLSCASLEVLVSEGRIPPFWRHSNDSIELEAKTITWPLQIPHPSESTGKEVTVPVGVADPDHQGEI